ncbi:MAG: hypothetical protein COV10_00290 [Candidatus Vogelbacteria bacterium CG10_big_fil_rev_8_21_14_0_10_51_16]|uniref:Peptidase M15B domain-containing protein n=1 Tax=Candidatus Vogelbacteria bacterium CG10_big_fil_rev_8_21_14_0_10_51_16 TaxID=1975045 RepID=A0A2H0RFI8_9BACT|nr:MAG: hypothetical protein COV10_00290 [Candidatus Vogelbacteria bacterium CG10_big_fil_rev_8_21_14_0_10_51_16]
MQDLVYIDEFGLLGSNFYWHKYEAHGLTKEDITNAGLTSDRVQVSRVLIDPLCAVNEQLAEKNWCLYVKEGYRSPALYEIIYKRRVEKYGEEKTKALFNMKDMPHAKCDAVDVALWDKTTDKEIYMRYWEDSNPALYIGFYKDRTDPEGKHYQELQDYLIGLMLAQGFRIGSKKEYFHFDYRPDTPPNYEPNK